MNRRGQVGLLFACTSPDKHPTSVTPPLLATMPIRQSENRQGQDSCFLALDRLPDIAASALPYIRIVLIFKDLYTLRGLPWLGRIAFRHKILTRIRQGVYAQGQSCKRGPR